MTATVRITIDPAQVHLLLGETVGTMAKRGAERIAARANRNVVAKGRVRTGALSKSYVAVLQPTKDPAIFTYDVGSALDYATLQEEGAGPSVAKPGRVLRFQPRGSSVYIFRRRTKGFAGAHQLRDAFQATGIADFLP